MLKWVINQDRDAIYKIEDMNQLGIGIASYKGTLIGYNLTIDNATAGTFATLKDVSNELKKIIIAQDEFVKIRGYCV